jgi:hypothetical protein
VVKDGVPCVVEVVVFVGDVGDVSDEVVIAAVPEAIRTASAVARAKSILMCDSNSNGLDGE